jgi:hypothetical protein
MRPKTGKSYARARRLCELLNDTLNLRRALWGEFVHHHVRAETKLSHRAAEELLELAGRLTTGLPWWPVIGRSAIVGSITESCAWLARISSRGLHFMIPRSIDL